MYDEVKPIEQRPRSGTFKLVGDRGRMSLRVIWVDKTSVIPEFAKGSVLSIGKFDGVHLGHLKLAKTARFLAEKHQTRAIAVTFDPSPVVVLSPGSPIPLPLTPLDRKVELLKQSGFDQVAVFQTGAWLLDLGAREFFDEIIRNRFQALGLVEGPDFSFGKGRAGRASDLCKWCCESGLIFKEVPPVEMEGAWITSSRIRKLLDQGELLLTNQLMGHALVTRGLVVKGAGRGRTIEIPTANLDQLDTILPAPGVYAASARVVGNAGIKDTEFPAAINIGLQPTFESFVKQIEVHMIGFEDQDLYGSTLEVKWLSRIRETQRFDSVAKLMAQIREDIKSCKAVHDSQVILNKGVINL
ncbi:MAG: riboflavin biosynthesis protein RibF [Planctomycetota bacterium]|nr:riboflavin biosynthesis protein RibF [Planctomycetota bacterium]